MDIDSLFEAWYINFCAARETQSLKVTILSLRQIVKLIASKNLKKAVDKNEVMW
jgi:hypothetical protein